jgi:hypothetical protein
MAVTKWLSVRAMPRPPCRIPLPYQCYHILSAGRIAVTGRLDAALVLWPTLSWAAKGTEFPFSTNGRWCSARLPGVGRYGH